MSSGRSRVVLALTPVAERAVEHLLFGDTPVVVPVASVGEADELEATARDQTADAVLISPQLSGLTTGHCERVRAMGLLLIGVALDDNDRQHLQSFAVDTIITPESGPADLVAIAPGNTEAGPVRVAAPPATEPVECRTGNGTALAVIGARGAGGASECAASLAAVATGRWSTMLVELDGLGGSLSVRLGTNPHQGSVLGLIRATERGEDVVPELLKRWVSTATGWPPVLLGPAAGDPVLTELARPGAVVRAMNALRAAYPLSVWDVGFLLTTGGEVVSPARIHREAIQAADSVLLILGARDIYLPAGLAQLDLLLGELAVPAERLRVLINGVGGPGVARETALTQALAPKLAERGLTADAWLPWDSRALEKASRTGVPLAVARSRGGYARALTRLLDELFLPDSTHTRQRKLKLSAPTMSRPRFANDPADEEEVALPWRS
jgi:MinD-like ATPase involved in chromosome partitioning or flagellar assembly